MRPFAGRGERLLRGLRKRVVSALGAPVVVLIYHRVACLPDDPQLLAVTPEHFAAQMRYLRDHFPVLGFDADWSGVREPSVVVTFDDGYADNFTAALPIMEDSELPATFFITSGAIDSDEEFWWDELERLILGAGSRPACCVLRDGGLERAWETATAAQRLVLYRELHPILRDLTPSRREGWLSLLREWAGLGRTGRSTHRALSLEQLQRLASSKWAAVGAHTVTHPRLSSLTAEEQRREILQSRERLETLVGKPITSFSYPFGGRGDYDEATLRICRKAGFRRVAANFPGQAHRWSDPLQIPRQLVRNWPLDRFKSELRLFFTS